jgi:regulator of protease activity HflC (stomatin/prohibitin superfamily)
MKNPFSRSKNSRRRIPEEESPDYPGSRSYRSKRLKIIVGIFTFIVMIAVISQTVTIIQAGHRGVVLFVGAVENRVLGEGVHFVIPFAETGNTIRSTNIKVPR